MATCSASTPKAAGRSEPVTETALDVRLRRGLEALPEERFEPARAIGQEAGSLRWLPVATAESKSADIAGSRVGLGPDASWWCESANALLPVRSGAPIPPLLCWLDGDPADARRTIARGLEEAGLPAEAAGTFPLAAIAEYGLRTTELWRDRSLRWLEAGIEEGPGEGVGDGLEITPGVADALGEILREELLPADTRRRVAELIRAALPFRRKPG